MAGAWRGRADGLPGAWRGRGGSGVAGAQETAVVYVRRHGAVDSMAPETMSIRRATLGSAVPTNEIDLGGPTSPHRPSSLLSPFTGRRARFVADELPPVFFFVM